MFTQLKTSKNANTGVLSVFFMLQVSQPSSREGKNHPQGGMGSYMLQSQKQNLEPNFPTRSLSLSHSCQLFPQQDSTGQGRLIHKRMIHRHHGAEASLAQVDKAPT